MGLLPAMRWALTPPFHPYLLALQKKGGLLSAALVVGLRPPAVSWHSALCSPDFPPFIYLLIAHKTNKQRSSGLPVTIIMGFAIES